MRTIVDIPDAEIESLSQLCAAKKLSRAELIRQAIAAYLEKNKPDLEQAFGLWNQQNDSLDGLAYQEKVRSEW